MSYEKNSKRYLITSGIRTPFVVKLPRATYGYGTWLVTTKARRHDMLAAVTKFMGARGGTEVLVSTYVNTKQELNAHIVVGAMGAERHRDTPLPLVVKVQISPLPVTGRTGGYITAHSQHLSLLRDAVRQTTRLLPESFVDCAGLDIVIDERKQWVVDPNPRFTGSIPFCLLFDQFLTQRGLRHAEFAAFP